MDAMRIDLAPMTADEFLVWHEKQAERYELIAGVPVRMTAGAQRGHNVVKTNAVIALGTQLRGGGCNVYSSDMAVRTTEYQTRYPDVVVDCGPLDPADLEAFEPTLVIEIASPSTGEFDAVEKLSEYQGVPSMRYILLVKPDVVDVAFYERDGDQWTLTRCRALADTIPLSALDATLTVADLYEGLDPVVAPPLRPVG